MTDNDKAPMSFSRRHALAGIAGASVFTLVGPGSAAHAAGQVHHGETLEDFASEARYKAIWLIKKNPAVSMEEFKRLYLQHALEVTHTIGEHLGLYRLSFPQRQYLSMQNPEVGTVGSYTGPQVRLEWDCITEMGSSSPRFFDALSAETMTTPEDVANREAEMEFVDYTTVISLFVDEYTFVS